MAEYSRIAKGHFTSTGLAKRVVLPFKPQSLKWWNYTLAGTAATSQNMISGYWDESMGQGFSIVEGYNATPTLIYDTVTSGGISTFSAGLMLQYGPLYQHTGSTDFSITAANPAVVTTTTNHNLATGDVVIFSNLYQTSTTGMQQIAGIPFMITRLSATTFSINWNASGSNYTAFNSATSTGNIGSFKQVLYPDLYFPGTSFISFITTGTTTTIKTTAQHNMQVGQEVAFHIPNVWGTYQLNELPNVTIPGSPIYGYIVSVTDAKTVVVNINSTGYTAFVPNQVFSTTPGKSFPQMVAVGDVNTGGVQISAGSQLYPPPQYSYATLNDSSTINGPAIIGAYVNNTRQGFVFGNGSGTVLTTGNMAGVEGNVIYYEAMLHDYSVN